jgi:acetylornithine/N-succinyldiaminopimelate aminotransferase
VMHTYGRLPVKFVSGLGVTLVDDQGREYLDFLAGVGAVSMGHCHPALTSALSHQAQTLWQVSNYFYIENRNEFAEHLSRLLSTTTDEAGHINGSTETTWRSFFCNSGAEANEGAIKLARKWGNEHLGGAHGIVCALKSFHGRTLATLAATGQAAKQEAFLPMPEGFDHVPLNDLSALEDAIDHPTEGCGPVCAVMLEAVQGEGGVWPADLDYLREVADLCEEKRVLLVFDEVQTGFFRNGAPFAYQLAGIEPDIVSMAKGIGGGFPMGAVAARAQVADAFEPGDHGSTFGGNALACAVGRAVLEAYEDEGIGEHVITTGAYLRGKLEALPHVTEVRGHGLMLAAQLDVPIATSAVEEGLKVGLVLNHIGDSILRFLPPLIVDEGTIDMMSERLSPLLEHLAGEAGTC